MKNISESPFAAVDYSNSQQSLKFFIGGLNYTSPSSIGPRPTFNLFHPPPCIPHFCAQYNVSLPFSLEPNGRRPPLWWPTWIEMKMKMEMKQRSRVFQLHYTACLFDCHRATACLHNWDSKQYECLPVYSHRATACHHHGDKETSMLLPNPGDRL